ARNKEAFALWMIEAVPLSRARAQALEAVREFNWENGAASATAAMTTGEESSLWATRFLVFSVICGAFLGFFVVRSIARVHRVVRQVASELGEGAGQISSASSQVSSSSQSL